MKLNPPQTLSAIAKIINAGFEGEPDFPVTGINEIHSVEPGDIVFVDKEKYYDKALNSVATTILINKKVDCPEGKALIFSDDPFSDFNRITSHFVKFEKAEGMISEDAQIGERTILQPGVFIGRNVIIGSDCIIHPRATIEHTTIGNNVIIHPNCVIGSDAFYHQRKPGGYQRLLSSGGVIIEDDVEIGAGCAIDRGVSGNTTIGKGTKIDNLVMVGHDTIIGKNCLFAAQVGIAGAVVIKDDVIMWGQVGIASKVTIGKGAIILAQSGAPKSLEGNTTYFGSPVEEARQKMKELAAIKQIPDILEKLK